MDKDHLAHSWSPANRTYVDKKYSNPKALTSMPVEMSNYPLGKHVFGPAHLDYNLLWFIVAYFT